MNDYTADELTLLNLAGETTTAADLERAQAALAAVKRAAWSAGASAARKADIALVDDVTGDVGTIDFIVARLRTLPLPEMEDR
jgi:hypothetical protein